MGSPSCPKPYPWCVPFLHPWLLINLKSMCSTSCIHEDCLLCKPMLLAQILILTWVSLDSQWVILPLVFPWLPPTQTLPLQSLVPAKMKRQLAHGSSLLEKQHPSVLSWNAHTPINPWLMCIGSQVEELVFEWQLYGKLTTVSYLWCCWPEFFVKVHPCWGSGSSHVDVAGGLGTERDQPIFISIAVSDGKESACNAGHPGSIPESGRSPGGRGDGNPLQCSCLENSVDRGVWRAVVPEVTLSLSTWSRAFL